MISRSWVRARSRKKPWAARWLGRNMAVGRAVDDDPGLQRGRLPRVLEPSAARPAQVAFLDHRVEVLAELAQQQRIGVELALGVVEDVVGVEVDAVAANGR